MSQQSEMQRIESAFALMMITFYNVVVFNMLCRPLMKARVGPLLAHVFLISRSHIFAFSFDFAVSPAAFASELAINNSCPTGIDIYIHKLYLF